MPVNVEGIVGLELTLGPGLVKQHPDPLRVNIEALKYDIGGLRGTYDGAVAQSVTDDDTSYIYLNSSGTLVINITGFPSDGAGPYIPLARVVAANGEIANIIEERVFLASSSSSVGTCIITLPVDGDVRGGDTSVSSNNDWAAVVYEDTTDTGEARNRLVRRTPRNYVSGDVVIRVVASVPSAIPSSPDRTTRWEVQYKFASVGESLGSLATIGATFDLNDQAADELFALDLTIPEDSVDMTKEYMALQINRQNDHADDNLGEDIFVHNIEIRYTGRLLAGQAGQ